MYEWIREAFADALYGKHAHFDVLKVFRGLKAADAKNQPFQDGRSIWDHLYHIVFWHDITLKAIEDQEIDWKAIKGKDWLPDDAVLTEQTWIKLTESFSTHLTKLKEITEKEDLDRLLKGFGDTPLGRGIIIEFQHNGYHIGQIVILRKALGLWPPPEDKEK